MVSNEAQHASTELEANAFTLLRPLLIHADFDTAATEFLGRLCLLTGCERASLGLSVSGIVKLCAVSQPFDAQIGLQHTADASVAAMEESLMQDSVLLYPPSDNAFPYVLVAHAELARCHGMAVVQTFPISHLDNQIGAITLESCRTPGFDAARMALLDLLRFNLGPLLQQKWRQSQPWWDRCRLSMREKIRPGAGKLYRTVFLVGILAACSITATVAPLPGGVTGEARLEAAVQRVITTPVDGFLKEVRVRPGDRVRANQLLAELNDDSLRIQQRQINAELRQQENALAEAMVKGERTQIAIRRARLDELQAERDLLEQHLRHTRLVAPFDGVIIKGDLSHLLGSPLKRGDMILTLSHGPEFRVVIDVPENDIGDVRLGQRGTLALLALPTQRKAFRITRISPVATVNPDGRNVFEVEAVLDEVHSALAPGMKGAARIAIDSHATSWQRVVKLWHALSYTVWSKLG
jgi:RND family efflux transporter MFP subunit